MGCVGEGGGSVLEKMARKKELRGFERKLKVFLQGLQCFKAQIRLCFKGMHTETTECADMRTGHSGSSVLLLSPLGAWSDSQQCLEPQLWSQTEPGWEGQDQACPRQPKGQKLELLL